jgi:ATP-dependent DNA helicase RecQ
MSAQIPLTPIEYLRRALDRNDAEFRENQLECIEAAVEGKRLLIVQRTGWGKSIVYFLATRILRDRGAGPTLIVSPLLSLMRNQIEAAERLGLRSATINSDNPNDWSTIEGALRRDEIDVLLISPERLANDHFRQNVLIPLGGTISLFVVDEAHCISDWGHDFRPDYRRISQLTAQLPSSVSLLATTATANDRVVKDVAEQLGDITVIRGPLVRASLELQNVFLSDQASRYAWLAAILPQLPGSGIVYTLTVRDADRLAEWLQSRGIAAEAYHAKSPDRAAIESRLLQNEVKVLVATVALGMGFDKPDLRFVIHFQRPGSVVHYYQQVGRAGRAVDQALGILLSGREDDDIVDYFIRQAFPSQAHMKDVLSALETAPDGLTLAQLEGRLNLSNGRLVQALKLLTSETPAPVAKYGPTYHRTVVPYEYDQQRVDALTEIRRAEQRRMQEYMAYEGCLMEFLSGELDDPHAAPCGRCANCRGELLVPENVDPGLVNQAIAFLRRTRFTIKPRKLWPPEGLPEYGFKGKIAALECEPGRALAAYGDAGWGELVKRGKYVDGRFDDALVDACVDLVGDWSPNPAPRWVTSVPSTRRPQLVPDFAQRLAARLELPYRQAIVKVADNAEQKTLENSAMQTHNLDGVFVVDEAELLEEPVLLIDDLVDSGWTLTVAGALLRQAGCPAVFPLVLADSSRT